MKINKMCSNEIIQCESTEDKYIFIKKYYDLEGNYRYEKAINLLQNRIGRIFRSNTEDAFNYLINNEGYRQLA